MARKPMTPQEYVDWYNSLPVDDTPLPESYVDRLRRENERLRAFVEEMAKQHYEAVPKALLSESPQMLAEEMLKLWHFMRKKAAALLTSAQTGGADDAPEPLDEGE